MTDLLTHRHGTQVHTHLHSGPHRHPRWPRRSTPTQVEHEAVAEREPEHGALEHDTGEAQGPPRQSSTQPVSRPTSAPGVASALAGLVATAGVIHVVATVEHITEDQLLGVFFALVGTGQLYAGWRIYRRRYDQRLLAIVAVANVAIALLWVISRTVGVPIGPESGRISAVGVADTIATLQEFAFAAIVVVLLRPRERGSPLAWLSSALGTRLTSAILSASLFMAAIGGHEH
jgi:hypothetical protein